MLPVHGFAATFLAAATSESCAVFLDGCCMPTPAGQPRSVNPARGFSWSRSAGRVSAQAGNPAVQHIRFSAIQTVGAAEID